MSGKSFYDLDYIIEINEQRLEQYVSACHQVLEKLTNIIFIYSAIAVFLIPVLEEVFWREKGYWLLKGCFIMFAVLFSISVFFAIRLVMPAGVAYLDEPKVIYNGYRIKYEQALVDDGKIENLLKISYVNELEDAVAANITILKRKVSHYQKALVYALLSALPYIICIGVYLANQKNLVVPRSEI